MSDEPPAADRNDAVDDGADADGVDAAGEADARTVEPAVVVVDAETSGNVGTIARAMKNFGLSELLLVDPPDVSEGSEAYGFAGHAREDVLPNAREVTFDEVVESYHTVATTAITGEDSRSHVRFPYTTPEELKAELPRIDADTALVFGREGTGLSNEELARMDQVASIPAAAEYPVLNLGQAATVTFYELRELTVPETQLPDIERERADEAEIERVHDYWTEFLEAMGHREYRQEKTERLFRRLLGRAHPTDREISTLMGVFRRATDQLDERRELLDELDREDQLRR